MGRREGSQESRGSHLSEPTSPLQFGRRMLRRSVSSFMHRWEGSNSEQGSHPIFGPRAAEKVFSERSLWSESKAKVERNSSQWTDHWRSRRRPIFDMKDTVKTRVREALLKPSCNVEDNCLTTGLWQLIARSRSFEFVTMLVIGVNSVWLAIDTDYNQASVPLEAAPLFQYADHIFCSFFLSEWIIRFMSFKSKVDGFKDPWFALDTLLVMLMLLDTWVVSIILLIFSGGVRNNLPGSSPLRMFRLLRLLRIARMARLLRALPELMILIKGMVAAVRSVGFTLALLFAVLYIFALAFTQSCMDMDIGRLYFPTISTSMYTLLVCGVFLDGIGQCLTDLFAAGPHIAFSFLIFVFLAAFTILNMLIGVLCEVVAGVAESEKEHMSVTLVKEKLEEILENFSVRAPNSSEAMIDKPGFMLLMEDIDAVRALNDVGVDPEHLVDLSDVIFDGPDDRDICVDKTLSFGDFMEIVLQFRGSNAATVKDVVFLQRNVRRYVEQAHMMMEKKMEWRLTILDENIRAIAEVLNVPLKAIPLAAMRNDGSERPKLLRRNARQSFVSRQRSVDSWDKEPSSPLKVDSHDGWASSPLAATARRVFFRSDRLHPPRLGCDVLISESSDQAIE